MSVNSEIRNAINKKGGDTVNVTLYLENQTDDNDNAEILECFKDAQVLTIFENLSKNQRENIFNEINDVATDNQKAEKIVTIIENLGNEMYETE